MAGEAEASQSVWIMERMSPAQHKLALYESLWLTGFFLGMLFYELGKVF